MAGVTVVLPTLNEAAVIESTLAGLSGRPDVEILVVDGGSRDGTVELARRRARVLSAPPGRARQMNEGAAKAGGEILLFLHADTVLSDGALDEMKTAMGDPSVVGGAFRLEVDSARRSLRWIARAANWRTRLTGIPYGDQALFVRRRVFRELGGYPDLPLMEDLEFARRLKRRGRMILLRATARTSSRRWDREGVARVTVRNQMLVLLYFLGIPPARLAAWYRPVR